MRRSLVYRFYGRIPPVLPRTLAARLGQKWPPSAPPCLPAGRVRAGSPLPRPAIGVAGSVGMTNGRGAVGVVFVAPREIQRLNRLYRGKDRPTDVLSFSADGTGEELGDLVICATYAAREARRRGVSLREELIRLLAHGTLHLLGLDHVTPRERKRMFGLQEKMVRKII